MVLLRGHVGLGQSYIHSVLCQWRTSRKERDLLYTYFTMLKATNPVVASYYTVAQISTVCFSLVHSVVSNFLDPMDCSMPGLPIHHQLPDLAQILVHQVGDAIQPSHPLSSPSFPAFNLSQTQGLFQWVSSSHQVAKVLEFQLQNQSFQWIFRTDFLYDDWLDLLAVQGTLKSFLQHHTSKASILWRSAFFMVKLSDPYMTSGKTNVLTRWTFVRKVMHLLFNTLSRLVIFHFSRLVTFLPRSKCLLIPWLRSPSAVIMEPKKIKSVTVSIVSQYICHEVMGPDAMIFIFWTLSFKPAFSLSTFTLIKRLFSSSSFSAIRVVSSVYLKWLIFLLAILIPACASSSLAFHMMYSASKLNKQGDSIQPWHTPFPIWNQSIVPCSVLTVASWLTCIQISQKAGKVVWYSHLLKNFPLFFVIHTVKGFGIVNKTEVNVFLELLLFLWSNRCWQFDLWFYKNVQISD